MRRPGWKTPPPNPEMMPARLLLLAALAVALMAAPAGAASLPGAGISDTQLVKPATYPGVQHLHYEFGPVKVNPGQNTIEVEVNDLKPQVPGYITRFKPDLVYTKGKKVPRVD